MHASLIWCKPYSAMGCQTLNLSRAPREPHTPLFLLRGWTAAPQVAAKEYQFERRLRSRPTHARRRPIWPASYPDVGNVIHEECETKTRAQATWHGCRATKEMGQFRCPNSRVERIPSANSTGGNKTRRIHEQRPLGRAARTTAKRGDARSRIEHAVRFAMPDDKPGPRTRITDWCCTAYLICPSGRRANRTRFGHPPQGFAGAARRADGEAGHNGAGGERLRVSGEQCCSHGTACRAMKTRSRPLSKPSIVAATIWRIDNASPNPWPACIGRNQLKRRPPLFASDRSGSTSGMPSRSATAIQHASAAKRPAVWPHPCRSTIRGTSATGAGVGRYCRSRRPELA
jgi:hypothetical protein